MWLSVVAMEVNLSHTQPVIYVIYLPLEFSVSAVPSPTVVFSAWTSQTSFRIPTTSLQAPEGRHLLLFQV